MRRVQGTCQICRTRQFFGGSKIERHQAEDGQPCPGSGKKSLEEVNAETRRQTEQDRRDREAFWR